MDALRRSVEAEGAAGNKEGVAHQRRSTSEKTEHPKRKETRHTGWIKLAKAHLQWPAGRSASASARRILLSVVSRL